MYGITALNQRQAQVFAALYPESSIRDYTINSLTHQKCIRTYYARLCSNDVNKPHKNHRPPGAGKGKNKINKISKIYRMVRSAIKKINIIFKLNWKIQTG